MNKDLTTSNLHRQNILNNTVAIQEIENEFSPNGILFEGYHTFTIDEVANIFEVGKRTIERIVSQNKEELSKNGYQILKLQKLNQFKELHKLTDMNVGELDPRIPQISVFSFKAVLNIAMLLTESENAKLIRTRILGIVMQVITQKAGDRTYINQRGENYLPSAFQEENYRKEFTNAIDFYIDRQDKWKYPYYTDLVYKTIFAENAKEYREILNLKKKDKTRDTFYSEVLDVIASLEAGFAEELKEKFAEKGSKLSNSEANQLFKKLSEKALFKPHINKARTIMASRDLSLRDALHTKLEAYIQAMPEADYKKFLGEKSKDLKERIDESLDVYKRLKDR